MSIKAWNRIEMCIILTPHTLPVMLVVHRINGPCCFHLVLILNFIMCIRSDAMCSNIRYNNLWVYRLYISYLRTFFFLAKYSAPFSCVAHKMCHGPADILPSDHWKFINFLIGGCAKCARTQLNNEFSSVGVAKISVPFAYAHTQTSKQTISLVIPMFAVPHI